MGYSDQAALVAFDAGSTELYNVKSYGATGGGTTDDTTAFQAAMDAIPAAGGVLYIPAGSYLIANGGLTCTKPITIMGTGAGTYESGGSRLICTSETATLLTLYSPGAVVTGVAFVNTSAVRPTAGVGLLCTDFDWGRVERCVFIGFWNNMQVDSGYFFSVSKCAFLAPRNYGLYMRNTAVGQFDHGDQIVEGCNFSKYGDAIDGSTAIYHESGGGLRIVGCKVNAGTQPGYTTTGFWDRGFHTFIQLGSTSVYVVSGCSVEGFYLDGVRVEGVANSSFGKITITGNEFLSSKSTSNTMYIDGANMILNSVVITGNVAYGSGGGINLKNLTGAVVVGNNLYGVSQPALQMRKAKDIVFRDNLFSSSIIDFDANDSTNNPAGRARPIYEYRKDLLNMTTTEQYGTIEPGLYSAGIITVRVVADVSGVGGVMLLQKRQILRANGAVTVGDIVGADLAFGPAAAELSITYDVSTSPFVRPKLTSVNGNPVKGGIEIAFEGRPYTVSYANI